jgi:hypothetical protein
LVDVEVASVWRTPRETAGMPESSSLLSLVRARAPFKA